MRLGKEQAAGFVEDTEADALPAAEAAAGQGARPGRARPTTTAGGPSS